MKEFIVTRLQTEQGIFRSKGCWNPSTQALLHLDCLAIMGSDGWVRLDLGDHQVKALLVELTPALLHHLSLIQDE